MKTYSSIDEIINVSNYELNEAIYRLYDELTPKTHKKKETKKHVINRDNDRRHNFR